MRASSIGLSVFSAVLVVLLVMTNMSYSALKSDYSALEAEKAGLEKEYLEIKTRYSDLNSSYSVLILNYSSLEKELESLKARYLELNDSYARLLENYTFLKMDYSKLQSDYQLLRGEYEGLVEKHEDLKKDYADLKKKYENLAQGYQSVESGYSEIKKELEAISSRVLLPNEFFPMILKQSLQADVERVVRGELGLRSDTPPELKARKIFEWITKNLQYLDDDYHQFIEDHELDMLRNFVSLPNETLARGGGDCEDLAVLAYAMLRSVLGESENVYLIVIFSGERGHVAVLYEYGGKFMIVDPAGNYVTDAVAALQFSIRKGSSYYTI
ncbi:MAG: hypothetical protein J7K49_07645, partial [Thaumarchaeota archaeon]|nr:hypothetical protein [Nitrososphaerota archaeon]